MNLNGSANAEVVSALLRNLYYKNVGYVGTTRTLFLSLSDGDGATGRDTLVLTVNDTIPAIVRRVTSPTPDGQYFTGMMIPIHVHLSEPVTVDTTQGVPTLLLDGITVDPVARFSDVSNDTVMVFEYKIAASDISADLGYVSNNALLLNGATAKDGGGNASVLSLATPGVTESLSGSKSFIINNRKPVATPEVVTVLEDSSVVITFKGTDADNDTLRAQVLAIPNKGVLYQLGNNGAFGSAITTDSTMVTDTQNRVVYAPMPQENGLGYAKLVFRLNDGKEYSVSDTITVAVTPVNDAPLIGAIQDPAAILEDAVEQVVNFSGISTGQVNEAQNMSITAVSSNPFLIPNPVVVYTSPQPTGSLRYTPVADSSGVAVITVTVKDDGGVSGGGVDSVQTQFTVNISPTPDHPIAVVDTFEIFEDTPTVLNVLANDWDPDGDVISIEYILNITNGTAQESQTGSVIFAPDNNFFGDASFSYQILDATDRGSQLVPVMVRVLAVNDAPLAGEDVVEVLQGTSAVVDVLSNDTDAENGNLSLVGVGSASHGNVSIQNNKVSYTPNTDYYGEDGFEYQVSDGDSIGVGLVKVIVNRKNTDPVVMIDEVVLTPDMKFVNVDVLANDTDAEGDALVLTGVGDATYGQVVQNGDGTVFYQPNESYVGQDGFTYEISDGFGGVGQGQVILTMQAPPGAPVASPDVVTTTEEVAITIDVMANDSDEGIAGMRISSVESPGNGEAVLNADGTITYTPNKDFAGEDKFGYILTNETEKTTKSFVTITVTNVNDAPVVQDLVEQTGLEDTEFVLDLRGFIYDSDNNFNQLRWEVLDVIAPVLYADVDDHVITVKPIPLASGTGTVNLRLIDKEGASVDADLMVHFVEVNSLPVFATDGFSPSDGVVNAPVRSRQDLRVQLSWQASDLDNPNLVYRVLVGTEPNVFNTVGRDLKEPELMLPVSFDQTFYWQVVASDGIAEVKSKVLSFNVQRDTFAPIFVKQSEPKVTHDAVLLSWELNEPVSFSVRYGIESLSDLYTITERQPTGVLELSGLSSDAFYTYEVTATDEAGNSTVVTGSFVTLRAPDTTPPAFSQEPAVFDLRDKMATIRFEALEPVSVEVRIENQIITRSDLKLAYVIGVDALSPQTDYVANLSFKDGAGNISVRDVSFTTLAEPDTLAPIFVSRPQADATHNQAKVVWMVNESSSFVIYYGLEALTDSVVVSDVGTRGIASLDELLSNTSYMYRVSATDASGNRVELVGEFKTLLAPDVTAPAILAGPSVQGVNQTQATVVWATDEPALSYVVYDTLDLSNRSFETLSLSVPTKQHSHRLGNLTAGVVYNYFVVNTDASGNESRSVIGQFMTLVAPDTLAPLMVSSPVVSDLSFDRMTVSWQTDEASNASVRLLLVDQVVFNQEYMNLKRRHEVVVPGLKANTVYNVRIGSADASGNLREIVLGDVRTLAAPDTLSPEILANPQVQNLSDTRVTIFWSTNEPSDGFVVIDTLSDLSTARRIGTTDPTLAHNVTVTNLLPDRAYYYQVSSQDVAGNKPTVKPADRVLYFKTKQAPDVLPPVILSGPLVSSSTHQTAQIEWQTNELSDSRVRYGLDEAALLEGMSIYLGDQTQQHRVFLSGLVANTTYYYQVLSVDGVGNGPVVSEVRSFTTKTSPDELPPVIIAGPAVIDVTPTTALIEWETDENSTSEVLIDGKRFGQSESVRIHRVMVTDLLPNSAVDYEVVSTDAVGNTLRRSAGLTFRTLDPNDLEPPSILEGPWLQYVTNTNAVIQWTTNKPTTAEVTFGLLSDFLTNNQSQTRNNLSRSHSITLTNLNQGAEYLFRVVSTDARGNQVVAGSLIGFVQKPGVLTKFAAPGEDGKFDTALLPDVNPPIILSGPSVVGATPSTLTIEWTTDESSDSEVIYGLSGLTEVIQEGNDVQTHRVILTNLSPGTSYEYQVKSTDPSGNGPAQSAVFMATTQKDVDRTAPRLGGPPVVLNVTDRSAVIDWQTDERSITFVEYGVGKMEKQESVADYVTDHQVTLTNLLPETTYQFRVRAVDQHGNGPTQSEVMTFVTESVPDVVAPVITKTPYVSLITKSYAVIRWQTDELSDSVIGYGQDQSLEKVLGSARDVIEHEVTVSNLSEGTTYHYRVQSTDRSGNGPVFSDVLTFTTPSVADTIAPAIPVNLRSLSGNGQAWVVWDDVLDSDLIGYRVLRAGPNEAFVAVATLVKKAEYVDDGLLSDVSYRYVVQSVDQAQNVSASSNEVIILADGKDVLPAPVGRVDASDVNAVVLFAEHVKASGDETYNFELALDNGFTQVIASASGVRRGDKEARWQVDVPLTMDGVYYWRVWAFDGVFDGIYMPTKQVEWAQAPVSAKGDGNGDGIIDFKDFLDFTSVFNTQIGDGNYNALFDFDNDGSIRFSDFLAFNKVYGK
ncbi:MAG: Ig-like domain-containing protein [Candidatus Latescibacterota bacterium]